MTAEFLTAAAAILATAVLFVGIALWFVRRTNDRDDAKARRGEHPWRPKSENSTREVPMAPELARWIRAHIRQKYAGERYLIRPANADKPVSPKTRERWVVDAFRRAGIKYGRDHGDGATLHTLRHTFASWLAQKDFQLLKIAKLLGDTVQTVEATYAHLLSDDLVSAVNQLRRK